MPTSWHVRVGVYVLVLSEFLLFATFGVTQLWSSAVSSPQNYALRSERTFQILSLVSKGSLGVAFLANVLILSRFECALSSACDDR